MRRECNNACGSSWCCRHWVVQVCDEPGQILLALDRGLDIRRWTRPDGVREVLGFIRCDCRHLAPSDAQDMPVAVCSRHGGGKPAYCAEFPDKRQGAWYVLPDTCPYIDGETVYALSMLTPVGRDACPT